MCQVKHYFGNVRSGKVCRGIKDKVVGKVPYLPDSRRNYEYKQTCNKRAHQHHCHQYAENTEAQTALILKKNNKRIHEVCQQPCHKERPKDTTQDIEQIICAYKSQDNEQPSHKTIEGNGCVKDGRLGSVVLFMCIFHLFRFHLSVFRFPFPLLFLVMVKEEIVVGVLLYVQFANLIVENLTKGVVTGLLQSRDEQALAGKACHPCVYEIVQGDILLCGRGEVVLVLLHPTVGIHLVEDDHGGFLGTTKVGQGFLHHLYLVLKLWMRDIHDMKEQVGLAHLIESALEGVHEVVGQLAYESHRVREQEGQVVHNDLAHRGVQCGKELVLGKHLALGKEVHEGGLAHIGVTYKGNTDHATAVAALGGLLAVYLGKTLLEQRHAVEDDTTVHLQLCLTRTTKTHRAFSATTAGTTALTLEVGPQALQTWEHVAVLRQFHLGLGIGSLCTHGKDVQDQGGSVQNLHLQFLFYVAQLLGREFVVKDDHGHIALGIFLCLYPLTDFLQLTNTEIGNAGWAVQALGEALHRTCSCRLGKELEFVQIFCCLALVLLGSDDTHQYGCLLLFAYDVAVSHLAHAVLEWKA